MDSYTLEVLYEDNHLLAVSKPAGLATMGTPAGRPSLLEVARQYVKRRYAKPGNVYLGVVSRLDAPVTGVVVLARTSKAARRLTEQFRTQSVEKTYWALVEGAVRPAAGRYVDWVGHDERHRKMRIVGRSLPGAKEARLAYRRLEVLGDATLLELEIATGRKHQIRLQLAHHGHPVLGDRKYGSRRAFAAGIALHALRLVISHPVSGEVVELESPLPGCWKEYGITR
jgi:23S rRNA pseudouridine1911/1915/1917 synthase